GYHYPVVFASPDIDENWNVDFGDFAVQANQWQQSDANGLLGDITMDGFVGMDDLDILGNSWLDCYVTAASVISPGNNAAGVDPNADLSWTVGDGAASHDVYFGTDFNDVNNANTSSAEFMVTDANTTFDPGPLDANSTYSWRIDEVGPRCKAKGDVWTFTTWIEFDPNLGLINLWMFDEGEGTTAYDSVGNNNGTLVGDPCWVSGKIGPHALEFDGAGDYVDLGDLDSIVGSQPFTITGWVYPETVGGSNKGVLTKASGTNSNQTQILMRINSAGKLQGLFSDGVIIGNDIISDEIIPSDSWSLLVFSWDGTTGPDGMKLYINETLDNTGQSTCSSIFNIDYPAFIGAYSNQGSALNYFDGAIDDVRIYNRALSDTEVEQLYQAGQ
ncbi:MAG: LamG domain-containing protein, partial [Planctomycetota bacterium]